MSERGHHLVIEAMKAHPEAQLLIVGMGPDKFKLKRLAKKLNVSNRVTFLGGLSQPELARYFQACDLSVLASSEKGGQTCCWSQWPVEHPWSRLIFGGTPEVVKTCAAGVLVDRNSQDIATAIGRLLNSPAPRAETRQYAEQFSWDETTDQLYRIFSNLLGSGTHDSSSSSTDNDTVENDKEVTV